MIEKAFEEARGIKVLFVGEAITDEYVYVEPLYKPSKETIIAVTETEREEFIGGVHAAAAHLKNWCKTRVVCQWTPIRKTRYVQAGFNTKLFEIYSHSKAPELLAGRLYDAINTADLVVALDFGHGLITAECREALQSAKFLAVNAQSNAGNHGFNLVTKYARAGYVCVDFQEARLAVGDQWGPLHGVIDKLCERMGTDKIIVTAGRQGAYWPGGHLPALETHPVDTMGAGDCFLAYTAPLIACGLPLADAALVGCVAASMKTEIVGHRASVKPELVMQRVRDELSRRNKKRTA